MADESADSSAPPDKMEVEDGAQEAMKDDDDKTEALGNESARAEKLAEAGTEGDTSTGHDAEQASGEATGGATDEGDAEPGASSEPGSSAPEGVDASSANAPAESGADSAGVGDTAAAEKEDEIPGVTIPVARVKRMMRCNPDKKKNFSKEAVQCMAAGMELMLADFAKNAYQFTMEKKRKTLSINDVAECIRLVPRFEFLDGPGIIPDMNDRQKKPKASAPPPSVQHANAPPPSQPSAAAMMGAAAAAAVTGESSSSAQASTPALGCGSSEVGTPAAASQHLPVASTPAGEPSADPVMAAGEGPSSSTGEVMAAEGAPPVEVQ